MLVLTSVLTLASSSAAADNFAPDMVIAVSLLLMMTLPLQVSWLLASSDGCNFGLQLSLLILPLSLPLPMLSLSLRLVSSDQVVLVDQLSWLLASSAQVALVDQLSVWLQAFSALPNCYQ
jgi:hypothetical protein